MEITLEEIESEWGKFKDTHKKQYSTPDEESKRKQIFSENYRQIKQHNKDYEDGKTTYTMGVNQFADLRSEEVAKGFLGCKK